MVERGAAAWLPVDAIDEDGLAEAHSRHGQMLERRRLLVVCRSAASQGDAAEGASDQARTRR